MLVPVSNLVMAEADWNTVFIIAAVMDAIAAIMAITVLKPMRRSHYSASVVGVPQPAE